jgi:UDP-2-acetamido-3-amino-2,3-dideoxy-glucuronate N-acetyltransferase
LVKRGATIGANAMIVYGNTIWGHAMVGAGAVVTHDVPNSGLVLDNPARQAGRVSRSGERLGPDLVCPRTGETYRKTADGRLKASPSTECTGDAIGGQ